MSRIPDSIKHKFERIIKESKGDYRFKKILSEGKDENFRWAYEFAYDRAFGKPSQYTEMELNDISKRPSYEDLELIAKTAGINLNGNGVDKGK